MGYKNDKEKERKRKQRKGGEGKGKRESDIKLSVVPTITEVPALLLFAFCPVPRIKCPQSCQTNLSKRSIHVEHIASNPPMASCCIQNKTQLPA